jgi:hypothetical protein
MPRWLLALFAAFPLLAHGGVVTITFENPETYMLGQATNFVTGGLRFSPPCANAHAGHSDIGPSGAWLSSDKDNSNCEILNSSYLGVGFEDFYVDRFGQSFTLLGLAGLGYDGHTDFQVMSSRGGIFNGSVRDDAPVGYDFFTLTGPLWTDITWFTLRNTDDHTFHMHMGWDDIRYSYRVDEPPTWLLLALPIVGFVIARQERKHSRGKANQRGQSC